MGSNHAKLRDSVTKFLTFFGLKDSTWTPSEQAKTVSQNFSFSQRYSQKTYVRIVDVFADTVSA